VISMKLPGRQKIAVPDNLDMHWRAQMAINGLMGTVDPKCHYEPYFLTYYGARPAYMLHWSSLVAGVQPKYIEALALMKAITGAFDIENEAGLLQATLDNIEEDGMIYDRALPERPWNVGVGYGRKGWNEDYSSINGSGRLMNAMWYYYQLTGDEAYKRAIRRCAEKVYDIAVRKGDYAYFPDSKCGNDFSWIKGGWPNTDEPGGPGEGVEGSVVYFMTMPVRGLMKWYQVSGDERMAELSQRLVKFAMKPKFYGGYVELDPAVGAERAHVWGHIHGHMAAFRGILDYATVTGDAGALEFCRDGYEWLRHNLSPQLGYGEGFEGCCVADWPAMGIALSDAGMGDNWDDVDHAIRNAAAQYQCLDKESLYKIGEKYAERPRDSRFGAPYDFRYARSIALDPVPGLEETGDVVERSLGAIANFNVGGRYQGPVQMHCCTGNGVQAFYYGWEAAIRHSGGVSTVNLFFTRFSKWMDLISFLPYEGKVLINNKRSGSINVRIPGWVLLKSVRLSVNGNIITPDTSGRYIRLSGLTGAELIIIEFPQPVRKMSITLPNLNGRHRAPLVVKANFIGSTCIGIDGNDAEDPTGSEPPWVKMFEYPGYYRRFREGSYAEKEADYHVPDKIIKWY